MSRKIRLSNLSDEQKDKIGNDLQINPEPSKYAKYAKPNPIYLFDIEGNFVYVPFSYNKELERPNRDSFPKINSKFEGELRDNQKILRTQAIQLLNSTGSVIIAAYPGYGKTCTAINIATKINLPTLILIHRIVLLQQWKDAIQKFSPNSKVQILTAKTKMEKADFYIMNACNVSKHYRDYYNKIGFLIVDECHLIMADKLSQCMKYILPRYLLGLSATPYRNDGLDILIDMYFGNQKLVRQMYKKHTVYKVRTGLKIENQYMANGKLDWNSILNEQATNQQRNELIIKIIKYFSERVFLVLCKRVDQANYLYQRLVEEKEDVTSLIGANQTFEKNSRILVGSIQKTGVGFDHPRLNTLILATDVLDYFIQYLGRVFRTEDNEPIIFDIVDFHPVLEKHFKSRCETYVEHGGVIKDFSKEFTNFL
jgi:superfamily II DNA or RNA helicase